jgi:RNA polymerase-binding transcription factor DksA
MTADRRLGTVGGMSSPIDEAQVRARLQSERERVESIMTSLRDEVNESSDGDNSSELAAYDQHPADQGSETFEREKDLSILEGLEGELAEIEAALQRVDEGTYGIDEVTGEPIDPERLDAVPTARTNVPDGTGAR